MSISNAMAHAFTGEISPSQHMVPGIFRGACWPRLACKNALVILQPDISALRESIRTQMERRNMSGRQLSLRAGLSESAVRDVLTRTDNPGISTLHKIAEALDVPFDAINGMQQVPLIGTIGAGGAIAYSLDDAHIEYVPRPPLAPAQIIALRVMGDSMLPKYDPGDIVYVRRDHDGVLPHYIGRYCAVHLADGGTYLKILARGSIPDRYTLRSLNAADMEDVEVIWASPVLFVCPQQSA